MAVYIGIDWSAAKHDVCVLNQNGAVIATTLLPHTADGLLKLEALRQKLGLAPAECLVGIETAHTLVIDFLWARDYSQVYVIPPNMVKSTRGRYRQSGARTDTSDALLVADLLRTDRARLHPWRPDTLLTQQLRNRVGLVSHLTQTAVRLSNRLYAVLMRYYPAGLHIFSGLQTQIALQFLLAYPTPTAADALRFEQFKAFATEQHYPNPQKLAAAFARLKEAHPMSTAQTISVFEAEMQQLAHLLLQVVQAKHSHVRELQLLFKQHSDFSIFSSLPGAGDILAPALLTKFGDDRQRFPNAESVQALAGTCPVTEQSGKRRVISFRTACDHDFRDIVQQWAKASLKHSAWAQAYWQQARPQCRSDSHAYRCLGNRWLAIAWKLWQTHTPYDEAYHLQQRLKRQQPRSAERG
jgi:transposase